MPPQTSVNPLDEIIIVERAGNFAIRIHRKLLRNSSRFFAAELEFKRQVAGGVNVVHTDFPRRCLHRYALWLYGSSTFSMFDPSLTAPEVFLELSNLHAHAIKLQDEAYENDLIDAMISHLTEKFDEMLLEEFLAKFLRTTPFGSARHKLVADWLVWSMVASDVKPEALLQQILDRSFCSDVVKALLKKKEKDWEPGSIPPYVVSKCFYHTHVHTSKAGCSAETGKPTKIEKVVT